MVELARRRFKKTKFMDKFHIYVYAISLANNKPLTGKLALFIKEELRGRSRRFPQSLRGISHVAVTAEVTVESRRLLTLTRSSIRL